MPYMYTVGTVSFRRLCVKQGGACTQSHGGAPSPPPPSERNGKRQCVAALMGWQPRVHFWGGILFTKTEPPRRPVNAPFGGLYTGLDCVGTPSLIGGLVEGGGLSVQCFLQSNVGSIQEHVHRLGKFLLGCSRYCHPTRFWVSAISVDEI